MADLSLHLCIRLSFPTICKIFGTWNLELGNRNTVIPYCDIVSSLLAHRITCSVGRASDNGNGNGYVEILE